MAHPEQQNFVKKILNASPIKTGLVYDFGSADINGSDAVMRGEFFKNFRYVGIDLAAVKGVDVVSKAHEFKPPIHADIVISCEMLEHDLYWKQSLRNMYTCLKAKGLLLITCATTGRQEHGTRRSSSKDSPHTIAQSEEWANYYWNLTREGFEEVFDLFQEFNQNGFEYHTGVRDIYFWGVKSEAQA